MSWVPVVRPRELGLAGYAGETSEDSFNASTEEAGPPMASTTQLPFLHAEMDRSGISVDHVHNLQRDRMEVGIGSGDPTNVETRNFDNILTIPNEPAEVIVARVLYALLISVSLVMNLLLVIAVLRCKGKVLVIYLLTAAMIIPDIIFYTKLIVELTDWGVDTPAWAVRDQSCGIWQFGSHLYPILYSTLLLAIVYHAFISLFLDHSGKYEARSRRLLPLIILGILFFLGVIVAPSGFYARSKTEANTTQETEVELTTSALRDLGDKIAVNHNKHYCDLRVPSITGVENADVLEQSNVTYRLVYELVLPYLLPLVLLGFPYVCLLVVVTLWLVTSYLMLHVATVLRNVFSIFTVWHKLTSFLDAVDDPRVPLFQTYIHITAYALTIIWAIARPALVFKFSPRIRKALGP